MAQVRRSEVIVVEYLKKRKKKGGNKTNFEIICYTSDNGNVCFLINRV